MAAPGGRSIPHLRQEDGGCHEDRKVAGIHQLEDPAGDEERKIGAGL